MDKKIGRLRQRLFIAIFLPLSLYAGAPSAHDSPPFFFGVALDGYPLTDKRLLTVKQDIGISPQMVVFFLQWPSLKVQESAPFPEKSLDAIWNSGAIPCLTWEPMHYSDGREIMVSYRDILGGAYDPYLVGFAQKAASWGKPFMIRFAHEMNIERYHWGTERTDYGPQSPRIYRQIFRYVVALFQKTGARNAVWVFCPNAESVPNTSYDPHATWNRIEHYYPGDAYVDILGMDGYNWGTTQKKHTHGWDSQWTEFPSLFEPAWKTLRGLSRDKPIFVFETASADQGGDKHLWTQNAFQTAIAWGLTGLVWFHVDKEYDWRIDTGQGFPRIEEVRGPNKYSPQEWIRSTTK